MFEDDDDDNDDIVVEFLVPMNTTAYSFVAELQWGRKISVISGD